MNILLIGSGAREHALAWKLKQSPLLDTLYCAPGNAGILEIAKAAVLDINDFTAVIGFCRQHAIGLVVVGPEAPLVAGLSDALRAVYIPVFGPSKAASELEASKAFTKAICTEKGIPTAAYAVFSEREAALRYAQRQNGPLVVKADGLAAGKGVIMCRTAAEADAAISACFDGAFGQAGASVVIEETLVGEEASFFAICDGARAIPLASAQDYKRASDGDQGLNTGGMGAASPAPMMTQALAAQVLTAQVMDEIVMPTLAAMQARGTPFRGVLYAGLMITATGPKLIEYNVRFGDPECQVLMLRLKSDLVPVLLASATGDLSGLTLEWHDGAAVTVVMATQGYPGAYEDGSVIEGLDALADAPDVTVFHAGTQRRGDGALVAKGGRVLNVAARGKDAAQAQARAYDALAKIKWPGGFYRRDIGWRSMPGSPQGSRRT